MLFTGKENHEITVAEARVYIKRFEDDKAQQGVTDYKKAGYFGREAVEKLLAQEGAVGIRIYYSLDENGHATPVIFAVDENGNNILNNDLVLEQGIPCPPFCPNNF